MKAYQTTSKASLWTGRVLFVLSVLFLLVDALMKVAKAQPSVEGSVQLGWPEDKVQLIGIILLISTILYIIPRTAVIGAFFITAYLGGAVAIMMRAGQSYYFPVVFGVLVWAGLYLCDGRLRSVIPLRKDNAED